MFFLPESARGPMAACALGASVRCLTPQIWYDCSTIRNEIKSTPLLPAVSGSCPTMRKCNCHSVPYRFKERGDGLRASRLAPSDLPRQSQERAVAQGCIELLKKVGTDHSAQFTTHSGGSAKLQAMISEQPLAMFLHLLPELADIVGNRSGIDHARLPVPWLRTGLFVKHRISQVAQRVAGARQLSLIHDVDVGDLEHPWLGGLDGVALARAHHHDRLVYGLPDRHLRLPDTDGLHE